MTALNAFALMPMAGAGKLPAAPQTKMSIALNLSVVCFITFSDCGVIADIRRETDRLTAFGGDARHRRIELLLFATHQNELRACSQAAPPPSGTMPLVRR